MTQQLNNFNNNANNQNSLRRIYTNMVFPGRVIVVDNSCTKTPSGVDASASDWDRGQVNNEHRKSNGEWCQNLQFQDRRQCVNKISI